MQYVIGVERTSLGVRFNLPTHHFEREILKWAEQTLHAPKMGKDNGRITTERGDPYYVHLRNERSFIFHKSFEHQVMAMIQRVAIGFNLQTKVVTAEIPHTEPYRCTFDNYGFEMVVEDETSRFFYQNEVVDRAMQPGRIQIIFAIQTGRGKALAHGTHVRTPGDWKPIEEIRVGDRVIGGDGKPTNVTAVFPQGAVDCYRVTFWDGRESVVCGEHLWKCFYVNTTENRRWGIRNTLEMQRLLAMPNPRVYIPLPEPEEMPEADLPLHPYLVGALLGDGGISGPANFFSSADREILDRVASHLPENYSLKHTADYDYLISANDRDFSVSVALRELGMRGMRSHEKEIPHQYFDMSIEQRWELVRGLMDTDGTVNKDGGQPSFTTTSPMLAEQFQYLVRSLGGIAKIRRRVPKYGYNGETREGRQACTVFIRHKTPSMFFHLERKKALCRDNGQYAAGLKLRVKSIEPVGRELATCITVDNEESLFVIQDFVVTHNTKTSQKVMVKRGVRTALIHRPSYVDKWLFDCCEDATGLREDRSVVHVAKGVEGIYELYRMGLEGELDRRGIKIVIIPTVSLMLFIKEWINSSHNNPVKLDQFYNVIGVGEVVMDEVHEHFKLVYLSGILMNPPALVEMSATLKPAKAKQFIADRYIERFPMASRVSVPYIPVVDVRAVLYNIDNKKLQGYASWMSPYNHKLVEAKMIAMDMEESYFDMIYDVFQRSFLANFQPGQKALVMFMTVEMCERFLQYARRKLDQSEHAHLNVVKYNAGDSYDLFIDADVGVSTPGKAGTAIDIPGLVHFYVTTPISDDQLNEQIAGRPREQKLWDLTPRVWFFHCAGIPKHLKYLDARKEALGEIVKSFHTAMSRYVLRTKHASDPTTFARTSAVRGLKPFKFHKRSPSRLPRRRNRR